MPSDVAALHLVRARLIPRGQVAIGSRLPRLLPIVFRNLCVFIHLIRASFSRRFVNSPGFRKSLSDSKPAVQPLKDRLRQRAVDAVSNFSPRVEYELTKREKHRPPYAESLVLTVTCH